MICTFFPIFQCGLYCTVVSVVDNLKEILKFLGLKSAFKKCFWEICCNLQCPVHILITWIYFLKNSLVLGTFLLHFAGGILSNRSCHKRLTRQGVSRIAEASQNTVGNLTNFRKRIVIIIAMHFFAVLKPHVSLTKEIIMITYTSSIKTSFKIRKWILMYAWNCCTFNFC